MQNKYQIYQHNNANDNSGIMIKIHSNVLESLEQAKQSIAAKDMDGKYKHITHAADFILRTQGAISKSGVDGIDELVNIYGYIYTNLQSCITKIDAKSDIDASMAAIDKLSKMWVTSGDD